MWRYICAIVDSLRSRAFYGRVHSSYRHRLLVCIAQCEATILRITSLLQSHSVGRPCFFFFASPQRDVYSPTPLTTPAPVLRQTEAVSALSPPLMRRGHRRVRFPPSPPANETRSGRVVVVVHASFAGVPIDFPAGDIFPFRLRRARKKQQHPPPPLSPALPLKTTRA